jgi:hypothetical protein
MASSLRASSLTLIRLQKLTKARCELHLSRLNEQYLAREDENDGLVKLQDDLFSASSKVAAPAQIIMKRLETNKALQTRLGDEIVDAKHDLLKAARTLDALGARLRAIEKEMARAELMYQMEEYQGFLLAKSAI